MIQIRPGDPTDAPTIAAFQVQMAQETEGMTLDQAVVEKGVQGVFEVPTRGQYWVAVDQNEVVGCLLTVPEWSDWRNGTVLWIHSVFIVESHRGRGIYRKLYENLKRLVVESSDLRGIRLYVDRRNQAATKVYQTLGMDDEHYRLFEWMRSE